MCEFDPAYGFVVVATEQRVDEQKHAPSPAKAPVASIVESSSKPPARLAEDDESEENASAAAKLAEFRPSQLQCEIAHSSRPAPSLAQPVMQPPLASITKPRPLPAPVADDAPLAVHLLREGAHGLTALYDTACDTFLSLFDDNHNDNKSSSSAKAPKVSQEPPSTKKISGKEGVDVVDALLQFGAFVKSDVDAAITEVNTNIIPSIMSLLGVTSSTPAAAPSVIAASAVSAPVSTASTSPVFTALGSVTSLPQHEDVLVQMAIDASLLTFQQEEARRAQ